VVKSGEEVKLPLEMSSDERVELMAQEPVHDLEQQRGDEEAEAQAHAVHELDGGEVR